MTSAAIQGGSKQESDMKAVRPFRITFPEAELTELRKSTVSTRPNADTRSYLQDFDRLQKTATSGQDLFDQMAELYAHRVANQSWLMFGFPAA